MTAALSTSHNPAVTAVRGFSAALGSGDILTALARLGDTVSWHEAPGMPYQGPEPYRGAQQVAKHVLAPLTADVDGLTLTNREILGLGTTVAVLGSYAGTARRSGRPLGLPYLHVWTVINDHITEFRQYTDTAAYRAILG